VNTWGDGIDKWWALWLNIIGWGASINNYVSWLLNRENVVFKAIFFLPTLSFLFFDCVEILIEFY
jgi:hypothetical protein